MPSNRSIVVVSFVALTACAPAVDVARDAGAGVETGAVDAGTAADAPDVVAFLDERRAALPAPGLAVCILKDGDVRWCRAFGHARIEGDVAATPDTPFLLASTSKTFTATAVMQRVEQGLDLDAPLALDFAVAHPTSSTPITTRMLLTHTSGIVDDWDAMADFYATGADPTLSLRDAMRGYFDPAGAWYSATDNFSASGPGAAWAYSNMAIALAGYVVEHDVGIDFATYCDEHVFAPLGLTRTSWRLAAFDIDEIAMPYSTSLAGQFVAAGDYTFADYPNGGLRASARDVATFLSAYARDGGGLLAASTIQEMWTPQVPSLSSQQGLVWIRFTDATGEWVGHSGGEQGVATDMFLRVDDHLGYVVLANGDRDESVLVDIAAKLIDVGEHL